MTRLRIHRRKPPPMPNLALVNCFNLDARFCAPPQQSSLLDALFIAQLYRMSGGSSNIRLLERAEAGRLDVGDVDRVVYDGRRRPRQLDEDQVLLRRAVLIEESDAFFSSTGGCRRRGTESLWRSP